MNQPPTESSKPRSALRIILAAINVAGIIGLLDILIPMMIYDSVVLEKLICAVLIVLLALITVGGFALQRRGRTTAALVLLAIGALPTAVVLGGFLYLEFNPID